MKTQTRNRAAQEATLINLRALQKRVAVLERQERETRRSLAGHLRAILKLQEAVWPVPKRVTK